MESNHHVARVIANHGRFARFGSVIRVYRHGHPPPLIFLKPCSIHARNPYQHASAACGGMLALVMTVLTDSSMYQHASAACGGMLVQISHEAS